MDDSRVNLYRAMALSTRTRDRSSGYMEMCAAGWMPCSTDMRAQMLSNPYFALSIDLYGSDGLFDVHFAHWMGEPVPFVAHQIHPLDTAVLRWKYAKDGLPGPVPMSVVNRACSVLDVVAPGIDPDDDVLASAVREAFPNWKVIGRDYFEPPKKAT